ncbi:MAG TPA: glycosyltransferase family 4 protein [Alphaproteobacteria bacterium]|nr:glycosyltransferase family 4 protein [Alphaproteobacteria bacterium]
MRIAFYAPLKAPTHPVPSGDRRMARLLMTALAEGGHRVELACALRSHDRGDPARQARLRDLGERAAGLLLRRYARQPERRPEAWFTYHLYHKAPDWIGPAVSAALGIPYVVAEASFAPKRATGPWALGHAAAEAALRRADAVLHLTTVDAECLAPVVRPGRLVAFPPFLDEAPYAAAAERRPDLRDAWAARLGLPADAPWLLAVGMFREGDKLASYRVLGEALPRLRDRPWRLIVCGAGPAEAAVRAALAGLPAEAVRWAGALEPDDLATLYAACDLMVWPAVNEAYGMALLEAQAAGLPVVAGRTLGVPDVVADGETGRLAPVGDAAAFAAAVAALLDDPAGRLAFGAAARRRVAAHHAFPVAVGRLNAVLAAAAR